MTKSEQVYKIPGFTKLMTYEEIVRVFYKGMLIRTDSVEFLKTLAETHDDYEIVKLTDIACDFGRNRENAKSSDSIEHLTALRKVSAIYGYPVMGIDRLINLNKGI